MITATAQVNGSAFVLGAVTDTTQQATPAAREAAITADRDARATISRADAWGSDYPTLLGVTAAALALLALGAGFVLRKEAAEKCANGGHRTCDGSVGARRSSG